MQRAPNVPAWNASPAPANSFRLVDMLSRCWIVAAWLRNSAVNFREIATLATSASAAQEERRHTTLRTARVIAATSWPPTPARRHP